MLIRGDARAIPLRAESVQCVVTSPPYWGLRDYGTAGQIGLEADPGAYVEQLVGVFREVRRVLRRDGTLWLNLGDSYSSGGSAGQSERSTLSRHAKGGSVSPYLQAQHSAVVTRRCADLPSKQLVGIPWRVALALQADGWYLRADVIWAKPNPMPESVTDRPTKAHEYVFLLAREERYHFDGAAIRERGTGRAPGNSRPHKYSALPQIRTTAGLDRVRDGSEWRNARSVWTLSSEPYAGAHFATMPPALARRCILAGAPVGSRVLDPFSGSGTTVRVARELGRDGIGLELSAEYLGLARARQRTTGGLPFAEAAL